MDECPDCKGVGAFPRKCRCGIFPEKDEPLAPCPTCDIYRWRGCHTCHFTGEVTPLKFRQLTLTPEDFEKYESGKLQLKNLDFSRKQIK